MAKTKLQDILDFERINSLLELFNKTTGFVTAILDLEGNVLSKSGWRNICTEFHRVNHETSKRCTESDTALAGQLAKGNKYHSYKCLNGLIDVALPIIINGEHVGNLFTGQFLFEKPDPEFFRKQAVQYGFDEKNYMEALDKVPIVSESKVKTAMEFLLNMTQLFTEMTIQRIEQSELNLSLIESEKQFRSIFELAPGGMLLLGLDGKFLKVNKSFCEMIDYSETELMSMTFKDITHPEDINTSNEWVEKLINGEIELIDFEKRYLNKSGNVVWCNARAILKRDAKDIPLYFITHIQDITERKLAEINLIELSSRDEAILAAVPDIIMQVDNDKTYTWANKAGYEFFGKDVIGKNASDYFEGEQETLSRVKPLFNGHEENIYIESWQRRIDGEKRLLAWWCHVLKDSEGIVTGALSSARDITEEKNAQEALIKSEQKFRKVLDATPFPIAVVDLKDNDILFWSNSAERILGHTAPPTMAEWYEIAYPDPDYRQEVIERWEPILKTAQEYRGKSINAGEYQVTCKDGSILICELHAAVLGENLIVTFNNITERKEAEKDLQTSENRFRRLITNLEAGIVIHAPDTSIKFNNTRASQLLGLSNDQMRGKLAIDPDWKFVHENNSPLQLEEYPVNKILSTKKQIRNLILGVIRPAADGIIWLAVNGFIEFDEIGEIEEVLISFIDITELKNAEDGIKKLNRELEQRVKLRTEELEKAKIDLESKNLELSRFNKLFVGREMRIKELRDKISELEKINSDKGSHK